jgi:hypothetical protein
MVWVPGLVFFAFIIITQNDTLADYWNATRDVPMDGDDDEDDDIETLGGTTTLMNGKMSPRKQGGEGLGFE